MRYSFSAQALSLITIASTALAQDCPTGYGRTIEWRDCPTDGEPRLECGIITVPLDYTDSSSDQTINVPLVRVQAQTEHADGKRSVIYNPGGPGVSGIAQFADGTGTYLQNNDVGPQFDMISFDPRGVGLSELPFSGSNYNCDPPAAFSPPGAGPYQTTEQLTFWLEQYQTQGANCNENPQGQDGQYMSSAFVARDIVAIFNALGEDGFVRYYGASYGTLLGATLSAMFPMRLDRVLLDGNINPTDYYFGLGDEAVADIDNATANYFVECVSIGPGDDNPYCALAGDGRTPADLLEEFNKYVDYLYNLPDDDFRQWYDFRGEFVGNLKNPAGWSAYSRDLLALDNYRTDSGAKRVKRQESNEFEPEDAETAEAEQSLALEAITCGEYQGPKADSVDDFRTWRDLFVSRSEVGGDGALLSLLYSCATWQTVAKERYSGSFANIQTRKPVLFAQTTYDPLTPLVSAKNSSSGFIGSGLYVTNGAGHCTGAEPNEALIAAVAAYFDTGVVTTGQTYFPKTTKSFNASTPMTGDADEGSIGDQDETSAVTKRNVYPAELVKMFREPRGLAKRGDQRVEAGCVPNDGTTTTRTTTGTATGTGKSTWGTWATTTKSADPTWSAWTGKSTKSADPKDPTWSAWTGASTKSADPKDPTWSAWSGKSTKSADPQDPTWSAWSSKSTKSADPKDPTWSAWTGKSTKSADPKDPTWTDWAAVSTKTAKPVDPTWSAWSDKPVSTVTVYVTNMVDVCSTGITTKTVTITATCNQGCTAKPTGVPDGYTVTKVWCDACSQPSYVDVTTSVVKPASAAPTSTWAAWTGAGTSPVAAAGTGASSTWATWSTGPSSPVQVYKGAAGKTTTGVAGVLLAAVAALVM